MENNVIWNLIDQFIDGMIAADGKDITFHIFHPEDGMGYAIEVKGTRNDGNPTSLTLPSTLQDVTHQQVMEFIYAIPGASPLPHDGRVVASPAGRDVHVSVFANAGGAMTEQAWVTYPADTIRDEESRPIMRIGSGTQRGVNTDITTQEGLREAFRVVKEEFPERPSYEHELILNIAASDWTAGHEERAQKMLGREYGLTLATRIIATLVATPGKPRGELV